MTMFLMFNRYQFYISQKINRLVSKDNQSVDTDEVISEIGTAMKNLLEKDENGFSWDLENKVKKRVLIDNDLYHLYSDREIEEQMYWYSLFDDPELTEKQKIGMLKTLIVKLTQWTNIELSDDVLQWRKQI